MQWCLNSRLEAKKQILSGLFFSSSASFEPEYPMNWIVVFNRLMEISFLNADTITVFKNREQFSKSVLGEQTESRSKTHPASQESFIGAFFS